MKTTLMIERVGTGSRSSQWNLHYTRSNGTIGFFGNLYDCQTVEEAKAEAARKAEIYWPEGHEVIVG